jgi:hypothetical protein
MKKNLNLHSHYLENRFPNPPIPPLLKRGGGLTIFMVRG